MGEECHATKFLGERFRNHGGRPNGMTFMGRGTHSATARILNGKEFDRYIIKKKMQNFHEKNQRAQPATENEHGTQSEERACELFWCVAGACFAVCCVIFWSQGRRNVQCSVHVHAALHALLSLHPTAHRVLARSARELRHVADAELTPAR